MKIYKCFTLSAIAGAVSGALSSAYGDFYYALDAMLLRANNSNTVTGTGTILDSSTTPVTFTKVGTVNQPVFNPFNSNSIGSAYFDGTASNYLTAPAGSAFNLGTSFTIEAFVFLTGYANSSSYNSLCGQRTTNDNGAWYIHLMSTPQGGKYGPCAEFKNASGVLYTSVGSTNSADAISLNTWHHVGICYDGTTLNTFMDGKITSSTLVTFTPAICANNFSLGYLPVTGEKFQGFVSNFRITKNTALYTSAYTVPNSPLSVINGTSVLANFANPSASNSQVYEYNNRYPIVNGIGVTNPTNTLGNFSPFSNGGVSMLYPGNSSGYNGTYLPLNGNHAFNFGTGDFTIETWIYLNSSTGYNSIIDARATASLSSWVFGVNATTRTLDFLYSANRLTSSTVIPLKQWTHISVTRTAGVIRFYINGVQDTASVTYSLPINASRNIVVFGSIIDPVYSNCYLSNLRISNISRYSSSFNLSVSPLNCDSNTTFLLYSNDQVAVTDTVTQDNLVLTSNVKISNVVKLFNNSSIYLPGYPDNIKTTKPINFGAGDFTIEMWVYPTSNSNAILFDGRPSNTSGYYPTLYTSSNKLCYYTNSVTTINTGVSIPFGTWTHVAAVKAGTTLTLYVNGRNVGSATDANTYVASIGTIGMDAYSTTSNFIGYMSDIRVTPGVARYVNNFFVTSDPYYLKNGFLLHGDGDNNTANIYDEMGNAISASNVVFSTTKSKFGNSSLYFNGTNGYCTIPYTSNMNFGATTWTFDCWFNMSVLGGTIISKDTYGSNFDFCIKITSATTLLTYSSKTTTSFTITVPTLSINTWYHLAYVRNSGTITVYLNGVACGTTTLAISNDDVSTLSIGCTSYNSPNNFFNGYIDEMRMTMGIARWTSNFTPPTTPTVNTLSITDLFSSNYAGIYSGDPYYGQVVSLLHMENTNGSIVIGDQKGNTITNSNVVISNANSKIGSTSAYFPGSSYLSVANNSSMDFSGDFTAECWFNPNTVTGTQTLFANWTPGVASTCSWMLTFTSGNYVLSYGQGGANNSITFTTGVSAGVWTHIALVRFNATVTLYVNGSKVSSGIISGPLNASGKALYLGANNGTTYFFTGYMDEVRITNGVARYKANFTPATIPFPDIQDYSYDPYLNNTTLITSKDVTGSNAVFIDESDNNATVTVTGKLKQGSITPYSVNGWSVALNNSTPDYLSIDGDSKLVFGTGDFTIEYNINLTSYNATKSSLADFRNQLTGNFWHDYIDSTGKYHIYNQGTSTNLYTSTAIIPLGKWTHIAAVRIGTTISIYINGVLDGSFTNSTNWTMPSGNVITLGTSNWSGQLITDYSFNGSIASFRIVVGRGVYTSAFTVSTDILTVVSGTQLLLCQEPNFSDKSSNQYKVTKKGLATVQPFSYKVPTAYNSSLNGSSVYFSAVGDSLTLPSSANYNLGTTFTIEFWLNPLAWPGNGVCRLIKLGVVGSTTCMAVDVTTTGSITISCPSGGQTLSSPANVVTVGEWNHFAISCNAGIASIYKNGVLLTSGTITTQTAGSVTCTIGYVNSSAYSAYLSDVRIIKDTALYNSTFTPPVSPLSNISGTQLLVRGNNAKILDTCGKIDIATTAGITVTNGNKKYKPSIYLNGSNSLIFQSSQALEFGGGDFTFEFWYYPMTTDYQWFFDTSSGTRCFGLDYNNLSNYKLGVYASSNGTTWDLLSGSSGGNGVCPTPLAQYTWHHIAVSRVGNIWRVFLNGRQEIAVSMAGTLKNTSYSDKQISKFASSNMYGINGLIEDIRFTKGVGRYVNNFVPPVISLPTP